MSQKPKFSPLKGILIAMTVLMVILSGVLVYLCMDMVNHKPQVSIDTNERVTLPTPPPTTPPPVTDPPPTTEPDIVRVVSTASIGTMGDLVMHLPWMETCKDSSGNWDFSRIYQYIAPYVQKLDHGVINLETTLCGTDNGYPIDGFPKFNSPDEIVRDSANAGFDTMLTANNHSYDTRMVGFKRTLETVRAGGLNTLGTMLTADEKKYMVQEINGIKVGMTCFTYAFDQSTADKPSLNGNPLVEEPGLVNFFTYNNLERFYTQLEEQVQAMREEGAEAIMLFIHWGVEYKRTPQTELYNQPKMAQRICDMGVDVIVGGHPHVLQPMDLLQSTTDPDHKTVLIYSLGNAISNQREGLSDKFRGGWTEDGVLFTVTFEKYSDGTVYLAGVDALPTWVNKTTTDGRRADYILPLDEEQQDSWETDFGLNATQLKSAKKSLQRTNSIIGEGLKECQDWVEQQKAIRDDAYFKASLEALDPQPGNYG